GRTSTTSSIRGKKPPAEQPGYWMTWSARARSAGGMVTPRALAVRRLMVSSNFVGCSTGRSPGLAPLEDLVHVGRSAPKCIRDTRSVGDEGASLSMVDQQRDGRQAVPCCKAQRCEPADRRRRGKRRQGTTGRRPSRGRAELSACLWLSDP